MVTPLARQIINQILVPFEKRTIRDEGDIMYKMADIHCFEISEIVSESNRLVEVKGLESITQVAEVTSFLPAPKTWIEFQSKGKQERLGFLLEDMNEYALVSPVFLTADKFVSSKFRFGLPFKGQSTVGTIHLETGTPENTAQIFGRMASTLIGALAFINTPRIIGRRQHMPNRGLEKKILKDRRAPNVFPLNAWTEIILHITPPVDVSNNPSIEAHLTGQRALHFCRAHLRIQHGKLVVVKAHWRGDPALGIVQTRYKVTP